MNKIHSTFCKAGGFSHLPPELFPSLTSPFTSDTNMGMKGNFLNSISSPLVSSQLVHKVGAGSIGLSLISLQNCNLSTPKLQTKLQLSVCTWEVCC